MIESFELTDSDFKFIQALVFKRVGINLTDSKRQLVITRLSRRLRQLGLNDFSEYINYLETADPAGEEFDNMVNRISTNTTSFFREPHHFDFLTDTILPSISHKKINLWSAASSSGEEPYSILISMLEYEATQKRRIDFNFQASDISTDVLQKAVNAIYPLEAVEKLNPNIRKKYFLKGIKNMEGLACVKRDVAQKINFSRINLMDESYNLPKMDFIFLRNVIIYFDKETKTNLIHRLHNQLLPGGYLFLGHSESIIGMNHLFEGVGRTIFIKK